MRSRNALLVRYPLTWAWTSTMKSSLALKSISLLCSAVTSDITPCGDNKAGASVHHLPVILSLLMRRHQRQHGWSISTSSPCCVLLLLLISPPVETTWLEHQYIVSLLCSAVLIQYPFKQLAVKVGPSLQKSLPVLSILTWAKHPFLLS